MADQIRSGDLDASIVTTFSTILIAFALAVVLGTAAWRIDPPSLRACVTSPTRCWRPITSVPTFIFYPLLVALLGLGKAPLVVLGILFRPHRAVRRSVRYRGSTASRPC